MARAAKAAKKKSRTVPSRADSAIKVTKLEHHASASAPSANQHAMANIRARVIEINTEKRIDRADPGQSQKVPEDPIHSLSIKGLAIESPFDMLTLAMTPEHNAEMNQCIEAMETNIDGFGHRFVPRVRTTDPSNPVPDKLKKAVHKEKVRLVNFFAYATGEDSFTAFRKKIRRDMETTGNAYFEVVRNAAGRIQQFIHLPSYQMRLGRLDPEMQLIDRPVLELQEDNSVKVVKIKEWKRFRKYVQSKSVHLRNLSTLQGFKTRWYKALGDDRTYNNETGKEVKRKADISKMKVSEKANELVHLKIYSARTPYGLPRYIGNLLGIYGDRAAEEINYITFRNNNIPSMVVAVSNGQLTEGTIDRIESFVESQIQGSDNYSKFLILEAETTLEGEDGGQVKMDIKPLVKEQHKDALFQEYSNNNRDQIRRSFRLPPIFVGRSDDYTRATAESSRKLADEQIFAPERDEFDELFNRIIFPYMDVIYHKFRSNSPNTTDNTQLVKILAGAEKTGGMTPEVARILLEDILSTEMPEFPEGFPKNIPFSLTLAEAMKNQGNPQAAVSKGLFGPDLDQEPEVFDAECQKCGHSQMVMDIEKSDDPLVDYLVGLNKRLEAKWQTAVKAKDDAEDDAQLWDDAEG